ncbi:MAG: glycosyltransferase [Planctomycetota bacterium]
MPGRPRDAPLTVVHVDAEMGYSGGEVQVFLLVEGLRRNGHRCILVCRPESRCEAEARAREIECLGVRMDSELDFTGVARLKKLFVRLQPDIVHLHTGRATWIGGIAARMAELPAVTTRRMDRPVKRNWRTRWIYGSLVERAVAISNAVQVCLREGGVPPEKIVTIPSAIEPKDLVPGQGRAAVRTALEATGDDVVVLALGSLVQRKGIDVLIEAVARLAARGVRPWVWIAGDGAERDVLEKLARSHGVDARVRFLGRRDDAADLIVACDIFVQPARREGLGVAALEAMALRRPVVASRVGGLAEAVADGRTGLLVPPGDAVALADALDRLVHDGALRAELGRNGPARIADGFQAEQMVASYEELYRKVLEERRQR